MNFSNWLRGVGTAIETGVDKVFTLAEAGVTAAPLPAPIKAGLLATLTGAQATLHTLEGLAGSVAGEAMADAVDDITSTLANTANAISGAKSWKDFSAAEKAVFQQTWAAMKAQGDTLMVQMMAGIDPTKPAA